MYFALLDVLRFFSAFGVLGSHLFGFYDGRLGVYLFFMISGFVIYFSLGRGSKEYVWFCCSITYAITFFYGDNMPIKFFLLNLLMINDGKINHLIDGSYWTLTFELLFYVYIGIFVWLFSVKKLEWFYISWLLISFFAFYFKIDQLFFIKLLSVRFAPYFVFGGMLALCVERFKESTNSLRFMYLSVLLAAASLPMYISDALRVQAGSIFNMTGSFDSDELLVVMSFFVVLPVAVALSYKSFAKNITFTKIAFFLGGITYPLYLLHWKIGHTIVSHYGYQYGKVAYFSIFIAVLIFILSIVLSLADIRFRKMIKEHYLSKIM
jgi:peptidoglycan/LPS O-acetylase OafA/YrhL